MTLDQFLQSVIATRKAGEPLTDLTERLAAFAPEERAALRQDLNAVKLRCVVAREKLAVLEGNPIPEPAPAWPPTSGV